MKKIFIFWLLLCASIFAMENVENREDQPWLPSWGDVKTYMGFGVSSDLKIPSNALMKAAYGTLSVLIGAGEIYAAKQTLKNDQSLTYSTSNIPAFILESPGISMFFHGVRVLYDVIPEMLLGVVFGKSHNNIDANETIGRINYLGLQFLAGLGLISIGIYNGMELHHFIGLIATAQISEKFIFKGALQKFLLDQNATPLNRIKHGIGHNTAAIAIKQIIYPPNYVSNAIRITLIYSGIAEMVGGIKDTIFLTGRVLSNLKLPHYESKETPSSSIASAKMKKANIQRSFGKKKKFVPYQAANIKNISKNKQGPSQKTYINTQGEQDASSMFIEEPDATTVKFSTWLEEQHQMRNYGITIESGPYGKTILKCCDITKTISTPRGDDAQVSGKKAETIRSMLSIAGEIISNTYSVTTIAMHANLNIPPY